MTTPFHLAVSIVIEECAELTQTLIIADRVGWLSGHPRTNLDNVRHEMEDVVEAIKQLGGHLQLPDVAPPPRRKY